MSKTTFTVEGVSYVGYATLGESNEIMRQSPTRFATWQALSDEIKTDFLIAATYRIDGLTFLGVRSDPDQIGEWPRNDIVLANMTDPLPDDFFPRALTEACAFLAGTFAIDPTHSSTNHPSQPNIHIKKVKSGDDEIEYADFTEVAIDNRPIRDEDVISLLNPYLIEALVPHNPVTPSHDPGRSRLYGGMTSGGSFNVGG